MLLGLTHMAYILAALLFITALAGLSKQETAKMGCLSGMVGMTIALIATFTTVSPFGFAAIIVIAAVVDSRRSRQKCQPIYIVWVGGILYPVEIVDQFFRSNRKAEPCACHRT